MKAECYDCGIPYKDMGTDLVLPDEQWTYLFPEREGNGILCANCICKRVSTLKGATVILAWIDCIDKDGPKGKKPC